MRFLAHRFKNHLEHIFISRYVMVGRVIDAVAGIEFFVIDEAKYFISYPLPFVVPADVGFYPLASLAVPQKSFLRNFLFCARPIFSSKRKRKLFCGTLL